MWKLPGETKIYLFRKPISSKTRSEFIFEHTVFVIGCFLDTCLVFSLTRPTTRDSIVFISFFYNNVSEFAVCPSENVSHRSESDHVKHTWFAYDKEAEEVWNGEVLQVEKKR